MAAKKKIQHTEETETTTTTETKATSTKTRIENGAVVVEGEVDVLLASSNDPADPTKTTATLKDGVVVSVAAESKVEETPKRKRGRPRKVRLEDGVVTMNPVESETEE